MTSLPTHTHSRLYAELCRVALLQSHRPRFEGALGGEKFHCIQHTGTSNLQFLTRLLRFAPSKFAAAPVDHPLLIAIAKCLRAHHSLPSEDSRVSVAVLRTFRRPLSARLKVGDPVPLSHIKVNRTFGKFIRFQTFFRAPAPN